VKAPETRRLAFEMYLEGLGFRSIGRILKISYGTVYMWIKKWSLKMSVPRREGQVKKVGLIKLLSYVESKKNMDHHGLLLIDLEEDISLLSLEKSVAGDEIQT
jgi:transposase